MDEKEKEREKKKKKKKDYIKPQVDIIKIDTDSKSWRPVLPQNQEMAP